MCMYIILALNGNVIILKYCWESVYSALLIFPLKELLLEMYFSFLDLKYLP